MGKTYQLCDPQPLTVGQMADELGRAAERVLIKIPLPYVVARAAIQKVPGVYQLLRIPAELLDYFIHPTHYSCDNTVADLEGSGIACPPFETYARHMVEYMKAHPEFTSAAMV